VLYFDEILGIDEAGQTAENYQRSNYQIYLAMVYYS
jgi:hypothetical protein